LLRRIWIIAALCAAIALSAALSEAQAQSLSAVVATATNSCDHKQIASVKRSLSSANSTKLQRVCVKAHASLTTVKFLAGNHKHHWMLAPHYKKWWQVPDKKWRQTVRRARALLRFHQRQLAVAEVQIQQLTFPKWLNDALDCIHSHEGRWTDPNYPYWGGLQMDMKFQTTYGSDFLARWGTADNWPEWAQKEAAKRAYESGRGFGPWPNTALMCGLSTRPIAVIHLPEL
jgi:hypothetical protein